MNNYISISLPSRTFHPSWTGPSHSQLTMRLPLSLMTSQRTRRCSLSTRGCQRKLWRQAALPQQAGVSRSRLTSSRNYSERSDVFLFLFWDIWILHTQTTYFKYSCACLPGDGETAGSCCYRPLSPFFPSPDAPCSSGPPQTDLPASVLTILHPHLFLLLGHVLFWGPTNITASQPRPPTASLQTQRHRLPYQHAGSLQLHLTWGTGGHASPDPTQRPRPLSARLTLLFSAATDATVVLLSYNLASSSPFGLSKTRVWTPGSPFVHLLPASGHIPFLTSYGSQLLLLQIIIRPPGLQRGAWCSLTDWQLPQPCPGSTAWSTRFSGKVCFGDKTLAVLHADFAVITQAGSLFMPPLVVCTEAE